MAGRSQGDKRSLYHRWRSRSFSEVVAQEHVTRTLRNAVAGGRIVHAYLFCGPRGTGKTSTARILAKAVNCLDPQQGEPCNHCSSCSSVAEGRAIDLIEIDAASNRGIDDARELRDKIKFSPAESRYKVYIIDEAHMLTSEASNALLKTLEEPPDHAILILATTEAHKILPTIASRCQRFDFRRIPLQSIIQQMELICEKEGLQIEAGVLDRVARMSKGSLRDAESLLDQLAAYCGERIDIASAREILGLTGEETVPEFAEALRVGDLALGFRLIDDAASTGADLRHFSRELVDYLRALMVARSGADTSLTREFRAEDAARLRSVSATWGYHQLLLAIRTLGDLEGRLRAEPFNQLHLEIAFMEVALADAAHEPGAAIPPSPVGVDPMLPVPSEAGRGGKPGQREASRGDKPTPIEVDLSGKAVGEEPEGEDTTDITAGRGLLSEASGFTSEWDLAAIQREWAHIVEGLGASSASLVIALRGCEPVELGENSITLGFEKALWQQTMERTGVRSKLEEGLGKLFGKTVGVRFKYGVKRSAVSRSSEGDAVVDMAVRELGFKISRVETTSD